jgi:16S rRNA A1518/A1519 N6-dimethyltransferase RsmA/KsgA/DIM1 with predicted DNA glycosylase/AP lyase activity
MAITEDPEGHEITALAGAVPLAGRRVLEIGCGEGRLTARYAAAAAAVIAIDPDADAVGKLAAERMPHVSARVLGVEQLDGEPLGVDVVLFAWSL